MAVLTPSCGHHCVASKGGEGPSAHITVMHCPCPDCHDNAAGPVVTGPASIGGVTVSVGWGDAAVAQGAAIVEEGRKDAAALDQAHAEMIAAIDAADEDD